MAISFGNLFRSILVISINTMFYMKKQLWNYEANLIPLLILFIPLIPEIPLSYSLTVNAFTVIKPHIICGYSILGTKHSKFFIYKTQRENTFKTKTETTTDNLDIFAYVNSKFIYVEKHIRDQMIALYHDILTQKCELKKQVLQNSFSIAVLLPDKFAYQSQAAWPHGSHCWRSNPYSQMSTRWSRAITNKFMLYRVLYHCSNCFITPKSPDVMELLKNAIPDSILNSWVQINPT